MSQEKKKRQTERKKTSEALGDAAPPKMIPKTIESMREHDETTVAMNKDTGPEDEETELDIVNDEFKAYFEKSYEPKVLITSGDNPHSVNTAIKESPGNQKRLRNAVLKFTKFYPTIHYGSLEIPFICHMKDHFAIGYGGIIAFFKGISEENVLIMLYYISCKHMSQKGRKIPLNF